MYPYWLLYSILAFGALLYSPRQQATQDGTIVDDFSSRQDLILISVAVLIILMIGLRFRVGGDWLTYLVNSNLLSGRSLSWSITNSPNEPGYTLINWVVLKIGSSIWLVNLICAIPFVIGLMALAKQQPNPYLALAVAAPLLIIVVGMGYTRQATALGFLLIAITSLTAGKPFWKFLIWAGIGSLFHFSVLFFIPIVALLSFRGTLLSFFMLIILAIVGYLFVLPNAFDRYSVGYIRTVYEAQGAIFRIALSALAGMIVMFGARRFFSNPIETRIWRGWALLSLLSLLMLFFVRSTVIVDRLSVYLLPLQVIVFGRLPLAFGGRQSQQLWTWLMVAAYAGVLFLWLTFANHARFWVPYRVYPIF
jgi:hypothetical protein